MNTREKLLMMLEENRGEFVSGAEIAQRCNVSGTAVWKAANKLKRDGYEIEAVTNKGYRLPADSDTLSAAVINSYLRDPESRYFTPEEQLLVSAYDTLDSTNNLCRRMAEEGCPEVAAVLAGNQTKGKGRRGRSFWSPVGTGLYMSILIRPREVSGLRALRFTTMAAVAVSEAIEALSGKDAAIKWVNDIYVDEHKVCGILTEGSFDLESGNLDYAVVGIGINISPPDSGFPEEIADKAGSVFRAGEKKCSRNELAAEVISRFLAYYHTEVKASESSGHADYYEEYKRRCFVIGKPIVLIRAGRSDRKAEAIGLDDECRLIVRYEDGSTETIDSGEISVRTE